MAAPVLTSKFARDDSLAARLKAKALQLGFDACRIAPAIPPSGAADGLARWLELGHHGDMAWMETTRDRRSDPRALWGNARTCVMLAMNYGPTSDPLESTRRADVAAISVYARRRDYHDVIKGRLKQLGGWLIANAGGDFKVFVDTAPVMEKPLAAAAGVGWQGKHTNLVSREFGSWLFLGALFTDLELPTDAPERDHCGSCRECLDVCPTQAFLGPHKLDARRCISYLTIEHKGPIPFGLREGIGNRVYGCDDCLAVCPWNKFAREGAEAKLTAPDWRDPPLDELVELDDAAFRARFPGSPVQRIGRDRFLRNVLIAIGNSKDENLASAARARLEDMSALVRGAAVWALARLAPDVLAEAGRADPDPSVRDEWRHALREK
jgi:epoxyqueuosine reductase